jgi:hypothetical protein
VHTTYRFLRNEGRAGELISDGPSSIESHNIPVLFSQGREGEDTTPQTLPIREGNGIQGKKRDDILLIGMMTTTDG